MNPERLTEIRDVLTRVRTVQVEVARELLAALDEATARAENEYAARCEVEQEAQQAITGARERRSIARAALYEYKDKP